jgi:mRNA interferase RelE/StbE
MLKLDIKRVAFDFLTDMQLKPFRQVMVNILQLTRNPYPHDSKKLAGYDYYRIDSGEFRVVYRVDDDVLHVDLVGKRNDDEVYRKLKNVCP